MNETNDKAQPVAKTIPPIHPDFMPAISLAVAWITLKARFPKLRTQLLHQHRSKKLLNWAILARMIHAVLRAAIVFPRRRSMAASVPATCGGQPESRRSAQ